MPPKDKAAQARYHAWRTKASTAGLHLLAWLLDNKHRDSVNAVLLLVEGEAPETLRIELQEVTRLVKPATPK